MCRLGQRMISRRVLPSAFRLRVYSMVRGSVRIRLVAIRQRALLAWRSPPRLSRCRTIRPDDAATGLTPHSAAKDRSDFMRWGLSPAATRSAAALWGPTPDAARSAGLAVCAETADLTFEFGCFCVEGSVSAGQVPQRFVGVRGGGLRFAGTPADTDSDHRLDIGAPEPMFDLLRGGCEKGVDLVGGLGACFDS